MKLSNASEFNLSESKLFVSSCILEDGEGPKWDFAYDRFEVDPQPEILLLGAYTHPNTGNNLVGGINLHYLSKSQVKKLASILPKIMTTGNLKSRYHTGIRLAPDIFNNFYRTYNSDHIRGVKQGVMYPKYGFLKSAQNWLKKKIGGIFSKDKDKERDSQPQYPDDISDMQKRLDDVVMQLNRQDRDGVLSKQVSDSPEMQRARETYKDLKKDKAQRADGTKDTEDEILKRNMANYIDNEVENQNQEKSEFDDIIDKESGEDDPLDPDSYELGESITYYSPVQRRYIIEKV